MSRRILDIPLRRIDGAPDSLAKHAGNVLLVVNVASNCGLTPQYAQLESLYQKERANGLEVLGFPANNFMEQEPGSDSEIAEFCATQYSVNFPIYSKISVSGKDRHPLYAELTAAQMTAVGEGPFRERLKGYGVAMGDPPEVLWNFEKFLVSRAGRVVGRFSPDVCADDPRLVAVINNELSKSA